VPDVLAFLPASNCYPAGRTPFPVDGNPAFAKIKRPSPARIRRRTALVSARAGDLPAALPATARHQDIHARVCLFVGALAAPSWKEALLSVGGWSRYPVLRNPAAIPLIEMRIPR
jgi:hypothetical protein